MGIRSMFSGVSGLQSHSTWLDVIGNNISNTNTVAYKSSRVEFSDQISQTQYAGAGPNFGSNLGGVNPQQVGLGTRVASIQTLFLQGPTLNTGLSTDIAIIGDGFMVAKSGGSTMLTRAGNLDFDGAGNLVDQNGGLIQGFNAKTEYNQRIINGVGAAALRVTDASLVLDNTDITQVTNIQVKRDMVLPPKATTAAHFSGNLDSFQQANAPGGILSVIDAAGNPQLPAFLGQAVQKIALVPFNGATAVQQLNNFSEDVLIPAGYNIPDDPAINPGGVMDVPDSIEIAGVILNQAQLNLTNAWEQQPPLPPAHTSVMSVYDSTNKRSVTIQFYQVNDLGSAGVNTPPMSQVLYAWYAFDTTAGAKVSNATLIGGTGIIEGDVAPFPGGGPGYDRGTGLQYWGDFIWFNTDGSLANPGGVSSVGPGGVRPHLYLPPTQDNVGPAPVSPIPNMGAEITDIALDFGTPGLLGGIDPATGVGVVHPGKRDGLYSDAEGTYLPINGVNTYIPNHTAFMKTQDGYRDGQLLGIGFDKTGSIIGHFSNGQDVAVAQLVMAMPENQEGLSKIGGNYYSPTANTGPMFVGTAGQLGLGYIQGNALEGSNVDLTVELSNMIIAQRGFEVNARVITVTNETLQTVTRLGQ